MKKTRAVLDNLLNLIVTSVSFAVILWFGYTLFFTTQAYAEGGICQLTAFTMAQTKTYGIESPIIKNLNCETQFVKVKNDGIYRYANGKYRKDILYRNADFKKNPEHYAQKIVADELHQCWKYLGKGNIDPFGNYDESSKCVICSQIQFDEEIAKKYPKFEDFGGFLEQNYVTDDETGQQVSYWHYLSSGAKGDIKAELTTEPQSILFVSVKPDKKWEVSGKALATLYGATGCDSFPLTIKLMGAALGKIPYPTAKISGAILNIGSKAGTLGGKGFAWGCKARIPKGGTVLETAAFATGSFFTVTTASGDVEPRIVLVEVVPTKQLGANCDKLYG